jgi:hypothetical protein
MSAGSSLHGKPASNDLSFPHETTRFQTIGSGGKIPNQHTSAAGDEDLPSCTVVTWVHVMIAQDSMPDTVSELNRSEEVK